LLKRVMPNECQKVFNVKTSVNVFFDFLAFN
jgi:hypothetical protein